MARVKLSPIFSSINGSIGGLTVQSNAYGVTLRKKPLPIGSASQSQLDIRAFMKSLQNLWTSLTDEQRMQWNNFSSFQAVFAKHNSNSLLSGYNLFIKYNMLRRSAGLSSLISFNFANVEFPYFYPRLSYPAAPLAIYADLAIDPASFWFVFKATPYNSSKGYLNPSLLRQLHPTPVFANSWAIETEYTALFGSAPGLNDNVLLSIQYFSTVLPLMAKPVTFRSQVTFL